jgi:ElaB/YqjD/DUF883 family membrane-anchored ribosome-binding protein
MDNETEVILEQMEGTRASLAQKLETLENQVVGTIQDATSTVAETVQQVKEAVTGTVETVKETVEGTVETVKGTVEGTVETVKETLDLRRQAQNHPWLMFGGSFAVGFVAGRLLRPASPHWAWSYSGSYIPERMSAAPQPSYEPGQRPMGRVDTQAEERGPERVASRPEPERRPGLMEKLSNLLAPEMSKLKGLAIGATLGVVRDLITQSAPPELGTQLADIVNDMTTHLGGEVIRGPILQNFTGDPSREREHSQTGSQYAFGSGGHH